MANGLTIAHKHALYGTFNASHTALGCAVHGGMKWADYLPLLKVANNDSRLFDLMRREWGDPVC